MTIRILIPIRTFLWLILINFVLIEKANGCKYCHKKGYTDKLDCSKVYGWAQQAEYTRCIHACNFDCAEICNNEVLSCESASKEKDDDFVGNYLWIIITVVVVVIVLGICIPLCIFCFVKSRNRNRMQQPGMIGAGMQGYGYEQQNYYSMTQQSYPQSQARPIENMHSPAAETIQPA